mgnify:CR=1 FL=1
MEETRVAILGIIVEDPDAVEDLNAILHDFGPYVIGRMGIPYHARNIHIISVVVDALRISSATCPAGSGSCRGYPPRRPMPKSPPPTKPMKAKFRFLFPFVLVFLLWEWAAAEGIWSSYILPSPGRVGETLCHMIQNGELVRHILISLRRIVTGFFWAFLSSCLLSSLNLLFPRIRDCYAGLLEVFRHVPPLSLIPLLILWFGIGELPKTIIIVLASFFPMYLNMDDGFRRCDRKLLEVGRMLGFSPWQSLWKIRLPSACRGSLPGSGWAWATVSGPSSVRK